MLSAKAVAQAPRSVPKLRFFILPLGAVIGLGYLLSPGWVGVANVWFLDAIAAIALTLLTGSAGIASIGNAGFLAIGAYAIGIISIAQDSLWFGIILGGVFGGVIGLLVALPALRLRGLYVAIATLALHYIVTDSGDLLESKTAHPFGYTIKTTSVIPGVVLSSLRSWYILLAVLMVVVSLIAYNLLGSRWGRALLAIRENELMASTFGINVRVLKVTIFVFTSSVVGATGAIFAFYIKNVDYATFTLDLAVSFVAMVIIGGLGSPLGAIVGAGVVVLIPELLQQFGGNSPSGWLATNKFILESGVYGVLIVLVLRYSPEGLSGASRAVNRTLRHWRRQTTVKAAAPEGVSD